MTVSTHGALAGVKVVDISRVLAGPLCTQILGDHGAEVIKVEPPAGDDTRKWGPPFSADASGYYVGVNRNKRDIAIDFSKPKGRQILLELLAGADVLVENFKSGTLERWGLGYPDVLAERFPRLVHCRISGFGSDGPLGGLPGYDAVAQAMSGLMSINGDPASGPTRIGVPIVDLSSGLNAAIGISMALYERTQSGLGQSIEVALFDVGISLLHPPAANWLMSGKLQPLLGNGHPNIVPYDKFSTATGEIFVGVGNDAQFRLLSRELDCEHLGVNERYRTNAARAEHRDELREFLQRLLADQDGAALCQKLAAAGVPAGPVLNVQQAMTHPQTRHRDMSVEIDGYQGTGIPIKLSRTQGSPRIRPPRFAEHTVEILHELGYSRSEIDEFVAGGIVMRGIEKH